jgi:hypothetical protein
MKPIPQNLSTYFAPIPSFGEIPKPLLIMPLNNAPNSLANTPAISEIQGKALKNKSSVDVLTISIAIIGGLAISILIIKLLKNRNRDMVKNHYIYAQ